MTEAASSGWTIGESGGLRFARSAALDAIPRVAHAFGMRFGPAGVPFLADSHGTALAEAAGVGGSIVQPLRQVHGAFVAIAEEHPGEADGIFSAGSLHAAAVRSADCVPLLIADREGGGIAAVHAGWRGTAAGIASAAVDRFEAAGIPAARLVVAVGPAIRSCCYEVGPEVVRALGAPPASTVDLSAINAERLAARGIPPGAIAVAPWCTRCRRDLFFSARGEGAAAGRMLAVIGPRGRLDASPGAGSQSPLSSRAK